MTTALALAFAAGLLSILSPCVLPLVPIVLGAAVSAHAFGAVALAAGLALSFTVLGLLLALVGFSLGIDAGVFRLAAAAIMIVLGIILVVPSWQARLAAAGAHPAVTGAVLAALRAKGVVAAELRGFADGMRALALRPQIPLTLRAIDIVGTGGPVRADHVGQ